MADVGSPEKGYESVPKNEVVPSQPSPAEKSLEDAAHFMTKPFVTFLTPLFELSVSLFDIPL
jgi:hypothetical protein